MIRKIASVTLAFSTTLWLSGAVFVVPVAAQSVQEQINALLAQIAALQAQLQAIQSQAGVGAGVGTLSKNLKLGMSDSEVNILQEGLKTDAAVYPEGLVTGYFGPLTQKAAIRFQEKYASEILAPVGLSSGTGFVGPSTRAKFNALYGGVAAPVVSPAPGVSPAPVPGAGLVVSLEAQSGGTVVADQTSADGAQALAPVLALKFSGSGKVTQLRLHRIGISSDSDFSNAYLYDGDMKLAEAPSVASGYFTFTNAKGLFEVNGSKVIWLKVDISNGVGSGKTFQFGIMAASDVVSNAVSLSGSFPFHGPEWRTANVSDLGKLTATSTAPTADAAVDAGSLDYEVWRLNLISADQEIAVSHLKFSMVGTAEYDAVQNLKLYIDGVQIGSAVALMASDKTLAFDLASAPIVIKAGVTKAASLRGDIVKGSGRNFYFQFQNASDIVAKDNGYGVFVKVNQSNVWTIVKPPTDVEISVRSGSLSVQKASNSPTGPLADGATGLEFARFEFKAVGEDIKLSNITVDFDDDLAINNLKVTLDGVQIGTTVSTAASSTSGSTGQDFNPGGSFVVPAGKTKILSVWGDLTHASVTTADSLTVDLNAGSGNALRMSSGSTLNAPSADTSANAISITAGALAVAKNASIANVTTVKGASGIVIGSWLVTAPSDQAVNVTSIAVNNTGGTSGTSTPGLGSGFDAMSLWSSGVQLGQTINSPPSATGTGSTYSLGSALSIPAGQSKQIDLKANILTNADAAWAGDSGDAVAITSVNSTGAVTNSALNYTTETLGQTVKILGAATVTLDEEVAPTMPDSQYSVSGDSGQTLAAWKISVSNSEDVKVNRIKIFEIGSDNLFGNVRNLKLYVDGVQVGATVPAFTAGASATSDAALFEDVANGLFSIVKNTSKSVVLKADVTPNTDATFDADGADMRVVLEQATGTAASTSNFSAKGVTSGSFVTIASNCTSSLSCNSNNMKVVKSKPTFALVSPSSTTLVPGEAEVLRFRITAHSAEDLRFLSGSHNIRLSQNSSGPGGSATTAYNFKLFDAATNAQIGQTIPVSSSTPSGGFINFEFNGASGSEVTVSKGTTKEFYVKANLTNFTNAGNSFKVDVNNKTADFGWNDNSDVTTPADYARDDFVGIGLPLFGPTFVKP